MKILTVDIGTGTQDIFLFDSRLDIENGLKMVVPSPTMIVHRRLEQATRAGQPVLLTGLTMGGGPSQWAAEDHLKAGFRVYATPDAARSFNDDLDAVREMGITLVSDDEAARLPENVLRLNLCDFDFSAIRDSFTHFGVSLEDVEAVAVAVFDHGAAPPGVSDRQFRFDYLDERIRAENRLSAFAFLRNDVPVSMTRLQAVVTAAQGIDCDLVIMDTAPAAVLGATYDPVLRRRLAERVLIANVGNFHTLAFRLASGGGIEGVFEHHTGLIDRDKLESLILRLASGDLTHSDVFGDHGHGALVYQSVPLKPEELRGFAVTGPRRSLLKGSRLEPHFAVPFGDMMIAGCFGLLAATADRIPRLADAILSSMEGRGGSGTAPWDIP